MLSDFQPEVIGKVSLAAKSLCMWVRAMEVRSSVGLQVMLAKICRSSVLQPRGGGIAALTTSIVMSLKLILLSLIKNVCAFIFELQVYGRIYRIVEPKQALLKTATEQLEEKQAALAAAEEKLQEVAFVPGHISDQINNRLSCSQH